MDNEDAFFKPDSSAEKLSTAKRFENTDRTARGILSAEAAAREQKTAHLRQLRLERQNGAVPAEE